LVIDWFSWGLISTNKLRLVIADPDGQYVDRLSEYIEAAFCSRIRVSSYTRVELLETFLRTEGEPVDILLVHPSFLGSQVPQDANIGLVGVLSEGQDSKQYGDWLAFDKFQSGDRLMMQVLDSYSAKKNHAVRLISGLHNTLLVSIYSPAGGAGKTSIALGLAGRLGELGLSVFCLSLETVNSMAAALPCSGNDGLTHVLLGLIENPDSVPVKVELHKGRDPHRHFFFLEPPQSLLELSEIGTDQLRLLLMKMKETGKYDVILLDLDSAITNTTMTALDCSDRVVLIQVPDCACRSKMDAFLSQFRKPGWDQTGLMEKLIPVINKGAGAPAADLGEYGLKIKFAIPFFANLWSADNGRYFFDIDRMFGSYLDGLARLII